MKKYECLHPPLVSRIESEILHVKNQDKAVKTRLHQIYGAYIYPNTHKKASANIQSLISPTVESCSNILKLHASTRERLPYYKEFYDFIENTTGNIETILDLGCGFNPFSLPFASWDIKNYHAIDIDMRTMNVINTFFSNLNLPQNAACADLIIDTPNVHVDLTFMLKLIPVLEACKPNRGYGLANGISTKWLVISFPTKSLGGHKKGMERNYSASFFDAIKNRKLESYDLAAENQIGSELVYVMRNV